VNHFESGPTTQQFVSRTLDNQFVDGHDSRPYLFAISKSLSRSSTVANSPSAKKRAKQAEKRRSHNASLRSMVRTYIKNVVKAIDAKDAEKAQAAYVLAVPVIDRMADKGIIHKNKAARHKGRLNGHIKALNQAAAA
jgi:small subunit ribosomal protein S20